MKKILCIILSALTLIAAAGCQKAPEASPTDPAAPVENAGTPVFQLDELPEIGGIGTRCIYVAGFTLLLTGLTIWYCRKRKRTVPEG